jgi:hypothetical protein
VIAWLGEREERMGLATRPYREFGDRVYRTTPT